MLTHILLLTVGLALVIACSDLLVDGASTIARRAHISEFVIGLTVVGFGTSCPELVVSLTGAIQHNADISVGNIIGSNIFNTLLILGISSALTPTVISRDNAKRDLLAMLGVTLLLVIFGLFGHGLSRLEGIVFLLLFALYMRSCFRNKDADCTEEAPDGKPWPLPFAILMSISGLIGLIYGGELLVNHAVDIARLSGVSDKVIAVTLLAGGTSLPELFTCVTAALKHRNKLALGNIVGSNLFNILLILGLSSAVTPLSFGGVSLTDLAFLTASAIIPIFFASRGQIKRTEGLMMILCFGIYMICLFR